MCGSSCPATADAHAGRGRSLGRGRNVALGGKATQKNTSNNGEASRAIDGNISGKYSDNGQTHTRENTADPWWEVDIGREWPIGRVTIFNRTDDDFGKRLEGFTLQVLDAGRRVVFEKKNLPRQRLGHNRSQRRIAGAIHPLCGYERPDRDAGPRSRGIQRDLAIHRYRRKTASRPCKRSSGFRRAPGRPAKRRRCSIPCWRGSAKRKLRTARRPKSWMLCNSPMHFR